MKISPHVPKKAKDLHPYTLRDVSPMKCIVCGALIKTLSHDFEEHNVSANHGMWDDGLIAEVSAGYGSAHDGDSLLIAICDGCLDRRLKDQSIIYLYDYISQGYTDVNRDHYNGWLHHRMQQAARARKLERIMKGPTE